MSTITITESDLATLVANAVASALAAAQISTTVDLTEPAVAVTAQACTAENPAPVLTRKVWHDLRTTKAGKVRKAFVGLTREQAHEAGLCPGYRLPTGAMRAALSQA